MTVVEEVNKLFETFRGLKVLIIGDVMIDSYLWGNVDRISPEAPVPVVDVVKREKRLGGAANVAKNIHALGAEVFLCSVVGQDTEGEEFNILMGQNNMSREGIVESDQRRTTIKHRIVSGGQHMLRVDSEDLHTLTANEHEQLLGRVKSLLPLCQVVILQDYDKGVLTQQNIQAIINNAREQDVPVVVDPKKNNFLDYVGASLFKPNLKELKQGLNIEFDKKDKKSLDAAAKSLKQKMKVDKVLVTLSEEGMALVDDHFLHEPAHLRVINDVSGAGDTVVSVAALCLAAQCSNEELLKICNLAGGLVCEQVGVVPVNKNQLKNEVIKKWTTLKDGMAL